MKAVNLIFPHQLFKSSPLIENGLTCYLIEEYLFFNHYNFHKQKLAFHRASMRYYEDFLTSKKVDVVYIESINEISDIRNFIPYLATKGVTCINYIDPVDNWLQTRIEEQCSNITIDRNVLDSPLFLNNKEDLQPFFRTDKKKYHQTSFYIDQRTTRHILLDNEGKPIGGKWTFDTENRKKYPAKKTPPAIHFPDVDNFYKEACDYVATNFSNNIGQLSENPLYPTNFEASQKWFQQFLEQRFLEFGTYEDAIVAEHSILNHSVLTPMLNVGMITPKEIVQHSIEFAKGHNIPINSLEGFLRQIIGWREFIRGMYESRGSDERTRNFWGFNKKIPKCFYDGTTGIYPVDQTIKKVLRTGYCHHIERLMVLGNFMLLCEFDPDEVYRWFMELFIDSYDWVMVPNVYGMSQFADGGLMASKPYISGSNYLMKMSNYKKGDWQKSWDGLFWRFMDKHRSFFKQNPRLGMLVTMFDKMPQEKRENHLENAEIFLARLVP
ncbi:cryptochrome/photolyase family protein [uncultured Eudoraea sp.]|uniref:cryptochrome/photolyase family protein n=1 Tax=uncultured Eudoraea sp. TaxID=1035614 RepID=UPI00261A81C6|nr:cryptochrome/photolyase family protein [uncultured Eudoraea sp.]